MRPIFECCGEAGSARLKDKAHSVFYKSSEWPVCYVEEIVKNRLSQRLKDMAPGQGWGSRGKGSGASFWDARGRWYLSRGLTVGWGSSGHCRCRTQKQAALIRNQGSRPQGAGQAGNEPGRCFLASSHAREMDSWGLKYERRGVGRKQEEVSKRLGDLFYLGTIEKLGSKGLESWICHFKALKETLAPPERAFRHYLVLDCFSLLPLMLSLTINCHQHQANLVLGTCQATSCWLILFPLLGMCFHWFACLENSSPSFKT